MGHTTKSGSPCRIFRFTEYKYGCTNSLSLLSVIIQIIYLVKQWSTSLITQWEKVLNTAEDESGHAGLFASVFMVPIPLKDRSSSVVPPLGRVRVLCRSPIKRQYYDSLYRGHIHRRPVTEKKYWRPRAIGCPATKCWIQRTLLYEAVRTTNLALDPGR